MISIISSPPGLLVSILASPQLFLSPIQKRHNPHASPQSLPPPPPDLSASAFLLRDLSPRSLLSSTSTANCSYTPLTFLLGFPGNRVKENRSLDETNLPPPSNRCFQGNRRDFVLEFSRGADCPATHSPSCGKESPE